MRSFIFVTVFSFLASAQSAQRNEAIFTGGYGWQVQTPFGQGDSGVSLGGTYVFRITPHVGVEAGVDVALDPTPVQDTRFGPPHARFTWVRFGPRYIFTPAPRLEISIGAGGAYQHYSVSEDTAIGQIPHSDWGISFVARAATPLDRGRRFWLGAETRYFLMASPDAFERHWLLLTGDLGFRF